MQFFIYIFIGGFSALVNLMAFLGLVAFGGQPVLSAAFAYGVAAAVNYLLCVCFLFRHRARWNSAIEIIVYLAVVIGGGLLDVAATQVLLVTGRAPWLAKSFASFLVFVFNFLGRRYLVFPEIGRGPWRATVGPGGL